MHDTCKYIQDKYKYIHIHSNTYTRNARVMYTIILCIFSVDMAHMQIRTNTCMIRANTYRININIYTYIQIHTHLTPESCIQLYLAYFQWIWHTCKYVHLHANTCKYINIHLDTYTYIQTWIRTTEVCRDMQLTLAGPLGHGPGRPGARGRAYNALSSRQRCWARQSGIQVGPHVPVDKGQPPASQSQPVTMAGSTGSESWGHSDVSEAVGINLVMHSVPGPCGRHNHVDQAAGPLARGYNALSAWPRRRAGRFKFTAHPTRSLGWILCLQCQAESSSPDDAGGRAFCALRAGLQEADNVLLHALARRHAVLLHVMPIRLGFLWWSFPTS